jgi:N-sulfoglucosamine sulfohydrolase
VHTWYRLTIDRVSTGPSEKQGSARPASRSARRRHGVVGPGNDGSTRLAQSGLRVEYAFGTSPSCSPSRISILTGKYPHSTGAEDLHTPLPETERMLPSYLKSQGYFTGHMAKTHYGPNGERQFQWYSPETAEAFPGFLDSAGTRPFFLWVGLHEPHRPYQPGAVANPHSPAQVAVPPHLVDTPETRVDLALYYDATARMDGAIGRMLTELDRRGLRDKTLVVFLSDNGAPFPREKGTLYDSGTRTPLIFSCAASIDQMAQAGKQPVWGALEANLPSARLAARLGFRPVDTLVLFSPPGRS